MWRGRDFSRWLLENEDQIRAGGADYWNTWIGEQTEITRFRLVISLIHVQFRLNSGFCLWEAAEASLVNFSCSLVTLMLGWWHFPSGPFHTIDALLTNARGGLRQTVGDLLDELKGHSRAVVSLSNNAARAASRIMRERGFPPNSAIRVRPAGRTDSMPFLIEYDDEPTKDGQDWRSEDQGVLLLVNKKDAPRLAGLLIDFEDGAYTFRKPHPEMVEPS